MKKFVTLALTAVLCTAGASFAGNSMFEAGLRVNHETIDAGIDVTVPSSFGSILTGAGLTINDDEFKYGSVKFGVKNSNFTPGIQYTLGFKGLYGEAYDNKRGGPDKDSDLAVLGFLFAADYEIPGRMNPVPRPITVGASVVAAPKPLCFQETETYIEAGAGIKFHVMPNAMITVDYRFSDMEFEENSGYKWDKEHHMGLIGYTLKF